MRTAGGGMHAAITGSMRKKRESISNKVNIWHLIFDSNTTTCVETYVIPTKWLKFNPRLKFHPLLPIGMCRKFAHFWGSVNN